MRSPERDGKGGGEDRRTCAGVDVGGGGQHVGKERNQAADHPGAEDEAGKAADCCEHEPFRDRQRQEVAAPGAERRPQRHLVAAAGCAREKQRRRVRRRDEQQQRDGCGGSDQRRTHRTRRPLCERRDVSADVLMRRPLSSQARRDRAEFGGRAVDRHAVGEPRHDGVAVVDLVDALLRRHPHRHP
jgi:hypothetical protein